jgi:hypothetical protein
MAVVLLIATGFPPDGIVKSPTSVLPGRALHADGRGIFSSFRRSVSTPHFARSFALQGQSANRPCLLPGRLILTFCGIAIYKHDANTDADKQANCNRPKAGLGVFSA